MRVWHGSVNEFYFVFWQSFQVFWPHRYWPNAQLTIVFDDEHEDDRRYGSRSLCVWRALVLVLW